MLKRREVLLININGITPEPEIQARYTVHKKKGVYLPLITGSLGVVP